MLSKPEAARRNIFVGRHWIDAFNRKEFERLIALYWDHATHYSPRLEKQRPETKGLITGKPEIREYYGKILSSPAYATLHYEPTSITADDDDAYLEYVRSLAGEQDLPASEVLKILDGKIIASRVLPFTAPAQRGN